MYIEHSKSCQEIFQLKLVGVIKRKRFLQTDGTIDVAGIADFTTLPREHFLVMSILDPAA
jgi:hypothetical protein